MQFDRSAGMIKPTSLRESYDGFQAASALFPITKTEILVGTAMSRIKSASLLENLSWSRFVAPSMLFFYFSAALMELYWNYLISIMTDELGWIAAISLINFCWMINNTHQKLPSITPIFALASAFFVVGSAMMLRLGFDFFFLSDTRGGPPDVRDNGRLLLMLFLVVVLPSVPLMRLVRFSERHGMVPTSPNLRTFTVRDLLTWTLFLTVGATGITASFRYSVGDAEAFFRTWTDGFDLLSAAYIAIVINSCLCSIYLLRRVWPTRVENQTVRYASIVVPICIYFWIQFIDSSERGPLVIAYWSQRWVVWFLFWLCVAWVVIGDFDRTALRRIALE